MSHFTNDPDPLGHAEDGITAVDEVVACLGDDAAQLRDENQEDERADNMDRAASMLTAMVASLRELLDLCAIGDVDENTTVHGWGDAIKRARAAASGVTVTTNEQEKRHG